MKTVYKISPLYGADIIKAGESYILTETEHVTRTDIKPVYHLYPDNGEGIPGNMNSAVKRYHGWRGTTNDHSVTALGLRRVESILEEATYCDDPYIKVKLSPDLAPDRP